MKGINVDRGGHRKLLRKTMRSGTIAAALLLMTGICDKIGYAADSLQMINLNGAFSTFPISNLNSVRNVLRYSSSTGKDGTVPYSNKGANGWKSDVYGASLSVGRSQDPFWTLTTDASDASSCGLVAGSIQCTNWDPRSHDRLTAPVTVAYSIGLSNLSSDSAITVENMPAGPREPHTSTRYTDTPDRKGIDFATGTNLLSPVPEPKIYAMMLTGLGLMGFVVSRR